MTSTSSPSARAARRQDPGALRLAKEEAEKQLAAWESKATDSWFTKG